MKNITCQQERTIRGIIQQTAIVSYLTQQQDCSGKHDGSGDQNIDIKLLTYTFKKKLLVPFCWSDI